MRWAVVNSLLVALCVGSALGLIYVRHESRSQFYELEALEQERDRLDTEWGRLQIEQSTWSAHGRVEQVASERLSMGQPGESDVVFVKERNGRGDGVSH